MTRDPPEGAPAPEDPLDDQAVDWLVLLRSGRASDVDRAAFAAWRQRSAAHEAAARRAEALWRDVGATRAAAELGGTGPTARRASPGKIRHGRGAVRRRAVLAGAVAASLAVAALWSGALGPPDGLFADHATARGERRAVSLADGSVAFLNTSTALSTDYSATERRVTLHAGEARFTVAASPGRPFIVEAASGEVRALGTVFAVRRDAARVRVVVGEGRVRVDPGTTGGSPVALPAGLQTAFGDDRPATGPTPVDAEAAMAWTRGRLVFNERPLAAVVAELDRYRRGRIVILDPRLEALRVSGVFDLDNPDGVLRTLEHSLGLRVVRLPLVTLIR